MNDPDVKALLYHVQHPENVDYAKAAPIEYEQPGFRLRLEGGTMRIVFSDHYASVEEARGAVESFLRAWELSAALQNGPSDVRFVYDRAEVIDRKPTPGAIHAASLFVSAPMFGTPTVHESRAKYPEPPIGISRDATVDLMFKRYCVYREGRTILPEAANYCLTVLIGTTGGRKAAASYFEIALRVLRKLGELSARKGGEEARKFDGSHLDFTSSERRWLKKVLLTIIKRAAEKAFDPAASRPQITMSDLPPLPQRVHHFRKRSILKADEI
jgi:hypothetical protein